MLFLDYGLSGYLRFKDSFKQFMQIKSAWVCNCLTIIRLDTLKLLQELCLFLFWWQMLNFRLLQALIINQSTLYKEVYNVCQHIVHYICHLQMWHIISHIT